MAYNVTLKKRAIKALEKINEPYYSSIKEAIYNLAEDPRPAGYKKLKAREGYRIRVADYRIIYEIFDDVLLVDFIDLGHRKDIYEKSKGHRSGGRTPAP
ncbi:MAG TPA: type II toxin-antitoxin system RelE/ParE family toxin [Phnomibacter sp.]|nr:type II toxin-antitoxin system RelE/ParE family toxin [Phnomibacter sp.]